MDKLGNDYRLQYDSACIDIGSNSAPGLPGTDPDGDTRTWDGDGDGTGTADIGCDEFAPLLVPDMYATIQAAIDVAAHEEVVLVNPGQYLENIDFKGKAIRVMSRSGAEYTTINGNQTGPTVTFSTGEELGFRAQLHRRWVDLVDGDPVVVGLPVTQRTGPVDTELPIVRIRS